MSPFLLKFVSPFLLKVKTASGAVAVQIVEKEHGQRRIVEHLGSAHSGAELASIFHRVADRGWFGVVAVWWV